MNILAGPKSPKTKQTPLNQPLKRSTNIQMANRSYLYALNTDPGEYKTQTNSILHGISEYKHYIPLPFQILVSADTRMCDSLIFNHRHPLAICGRYQHGKERLFDFLEALSTRRLYPETELRQRINSSLAFFNENNSTLSYTLLECGELFEMSDEEPEKQNNELLEEILNIEDMIADFYTELDVFNLRLQNLQRQLNEQLKPQYLLQKLFQKKAEPDTTAIEKEIAKIEQEKWFILGIDSWSRHLYHSPGGNNLPAAGR